MSYTINHLKNQSVVSKKEANRRKKISRALKIYWTDEINKLEASKRSKEIHRSPAYKRKWRKSVKAAWKKSKIAWSKALKNSQRKYEKQIRKRLENEGWTVLSKGWPDFLCIKGHLIKFVEAKGLKDNLNLDQEKMLMIFRKLGFDVEIIRGVGKAKRRSNLKYLKEK